MSIGSQRDDAGVHGASRWSRLAVAVAVLLPALALCYHPLVNNDLPMHLAIGEYVLEHGIPNADPFSFTAPERRWVPHEWLAGVAFALADRAAGATGLMALLMLLVALTAVAQWRVARRLGVDDEDVLIWGVAIWLVVGPRLMLRPHVLFYALSMATWWTLLVGRTHPRRLAWLLPILAVWVNVHGSYVVAYGIVALDLVICGRRHPLPARTRYRYVALACLALPLQLHAWRQPSFFAGVEHALRLTSDPVFTSQIEEWRSPFAAGSVPFRRSYAFVGALLLVLASAIACVRSRAKLAERVPLAYVLFVFVTLILAARSQRFVALFALSVLPMLPAVAPGAGWWARVPSPRVGANRLVAAGAVAVLTTLLYVGVGLPYRFGEPLRASGRGWYDGPGRLPIAELRYVRDKSAIAGPALCEYHFGGAVAWLGHGRWQPSLDSRNMVYGRETYTRMMRVLACLELGTSRVPMPNDPRVRAENEAARRELESLLARVVLVVISHPSLDPYRTGLFERLQDDPSWQSIQLIPSGQDARGPVVFVRTQPRKRGTG